MKISRNKIIKFAVMLVFLCCMLFANFYAVRMMLRYGVDTYFYDKLLVAYTVGGRQGLKLELDKILVTDKLPRESMLAKDFTAREKTLADPEAFLKDKVQKSKNMIFSIRYLRSIAIVIMIILFGWQLITNSSAKSRLKNPPKP
ncbi:MAG: hypothetical protein NT014_04745 [Candidatus Omnitrophica bacterium]|nr:hypothetical protein [Candidatus Omnitrophota bacterium]